MEQDAQTFAAWGVIANGPMPTGNAAPVSKNVPSPLPQRTDTLSEPSKSRSTCASSPPVFGREWDASWSKITNATLTENFPPGFTCGTVPPSNGGVCDATAWQVTWTFGSTLPAQLSYSVVPYLKTSGTEAFSGTLAFTASGTKGQLPIQDLGIGSVICVPAPTPCCGDSNGDGTVSTGEATNAVLALVIRDLSKNPQADCNGDGAVSTGEATAVVRGLVNRVCNVASTGGLGDILH